MHPIPQQIQFQFYKYSHFGYIPYCKLAELNCILYIGIPRVGSSIVASHIPYL